MSLTVCLRYRYAQNKPPEKNCKDSIHTEHDQEERRRPIRDLILCRRKRSYGEMRKIPKRERPGIDATDGALFGNPICERKGTIERSHQLDDEG